MTRYEKAQDEPDCWIIVIHDDDGQSYRLPFYSEEARDECFDLLVAEEVSA